jgi:uncharacterized protein YukE
VSGLPIEELVRRVERTRPEQLRASAKVFDDAHEQFRNVRGQMNGVIVDTIILWDSGAGRAFRGYADELLRGLGDVGYTLGFLARNLREHAKVAEDVRNELPKWRTDDSDHPYIQSDFVKAEIIEGLLKHFRDSEVRVRDAFWKWGEAAPGKLPVPTLPPPEEQSWWESFLFGPGPEPSWLTKDGDPWHGEGAPYGYDEEGNLVPAHRAAYPGEWYRYQQSGIPVGSILKWIARGGKGARGFRSADEAADAMMDIVNRSHGWRPEHMDRHIKEFYKLDPDPAVPAPAWARDEFVRMMRTAGAESGKVFGWSLPPAGTNVRQATWAVLHRDPNTRQWLVMQFYQSGPRAGEFATAFRPTPSQLNRMLQENALG